MTTFYVDFVEDRDVGTVEAETRAGAFRKASRKFEATPRYVSTEEP